MAKIEFLRLSTGHSCTTLWVKNSLEIALSVTVFEIFTLFHFFSRWPPKIKILPLCIRQSSTTLWVKNLREIAVSLTVLEIFTLFIFRKNPRWPSKVAKIEILPLSTGYYCNTLWVKNSLEIALSLAVCEIFVIFHIFTISSNKVTITHLSLSNSCET